MKNTMTAIDLDRLEALANKATPGPWRYADSEDHVTITGFIFAGFDDLFTLQRDSAQGVMDAEFIAAANPQTILALIARIREMEAALAPFAAIQPSTFYPADGSEREEYGAILREPFSSPPAFTGEDLARARAAMMETKP